MIFPVHKSLSIKLTVHKAFLTYLTWWQFSALSAPLANLQGNSIHVGAGNKHSYMFTVLDDLALQSEI
jgi:hypothetical protein